VIQPTEEVDQNVPERPTKAGLSWSVRVGVLGSGRPGTRTVRVGVNAMLAWIKPVATSTPKSALELHASGSTMESASLTRSQSAPSTPMPLFWIAATRACCAMSVATAPAPASSSVTKKNQPRPLLAILELAHAERDLHEPLRARDLDGALALELRAHRCVLFGQALHLCCEARSLRLCLAALGETLAHSLEELHDLARELGSVDLVAGIFTEQALELRDGRTLSTDEEVRGGEVLPRLEDERETLEARTLSAHERLETVDGALPVLRLVALTGREEVLERPCVRDRLGDEEDRQRERHGGRPDHGRRTWPAADEDRRHSCAPSSGDASGSSVTLTVVEVSPAWSSTSPVYAR
jgi:hypothetical protein